MPWPKGKKRSLETRQKMSATHRCRLSDCYEREKMENCLALSPSRNGYFSTEHRRNLSLASQGIPKTAAHRNNIGKSKRGTVLSEEHKAKIAIANKGKHSKRGRVQSDDERAMRSEAQKLRYLRPGERERQAIGIQNRWNQVGNKHSSETIEKMKGARARQVIPLIDTKPEQTVQKILKVLGVRFESHRAVKGLGRHQWDIVLRDVRLLIEVDGCYWHGCSRCCPHSEIGRQNHQRDYVLDMKAVTEGWQVLRIWEHDIIGGEATAIIQNQVSKQGIFESVG